MSSFPAALPIDALLAASQAHPAFKADVLAYAAFARADRLTVATHLPRVKVLRVLAQLLATEPTLIVESVAIRAQSGCADFRGELRATVNGVERTWTFVWDCRWRARESGIVDALGYPDQSRAAREFGWRCFERWAELATATA